MGVGVVIAAVAVLAAAAGTAPAAAQAVDVLACRGSFYGYPSELSGRRLYRPYNALGDGEVHFDGEIRNAVGVGRVVYQGYTNTAPFEGVVYNSALRIGVEVLDATGESGREMIIYDGTPTLGPPTVVGHFTCRWN